MLILPYDTETTGYMCGHDYTNPSNAYLAALTGILYDTEANRIVSSLNLMVTPDTWTMPPSAGEVNGLSTSMLLAYGLPATVVVPAFLHLAERADLLVAHNCPFDSKIMAAALWRHAESIDLPEEQAHELVRAWQQKKQFCTMKATKPFVQARSANNRLKGPKLIEAYEHAFGRPLDRAHSANADTIAVLELYNWLQNNEEVTL